MNTPAAHSWICPQCERRVPVGEPVCHCGFDRRKAPFRDRASPPSPSTGAVLTSRRAVLVAALVASACGLLLYAGAGLRGRTPHHAASAPAESGPTRRDARYPPLPAVAVEDGSASEPPESEAGEAPPSPAAEPARVVVVPGSAEHATEPRTPRTMPAAPADPVAAPPPTAMEEAWGRATSLLEPRLGKVARETAALEARYGPFAEACVASAKGAGPGAGPERNWIAALKTGPGAAGWDAAIPLTDRGPTVDCQGVWRDLVSRADELKAELDRTENLARTSGVLPGHWRKLLATHGLEAWDAY